uniref:Metalloendopeptidase n=1 Tax=Parastrongyloides trichosuri TaxID=131310 RepID=A0A0N4Z8G1_PARTI
MGLSYSNVEVNNSVGFNFRRGESCTAPVGPSSRDGKSYEYITLTEECEKQQGTIQQLTAKMLGMINTNNRPDRDTFIQVKRNNIKKGMEELFKKYDWKQVRLYKNISYDYGSALHYSGSYMGKKSSIVLKPKLSKYYSNMLGQYYELSFNDLKIINQLYSNRFWGHIGDCQNGGYVRPFFRRECLCPNGFVGRYCNETEPNTGGCKESELKATKKEQRFIINGAKNCTHLIKSAPGTKIQIVMKRIKTQKKSPCYQKMGLEVKYVKDKGATGLCLCGKYNYIKLKSQDNKVLIQYTGKEKSSSATVYYKAISK